MSNEIESNEVILLLKQLVRSQDSMNETLQDILNLFKKYDIDELMYSEDLRDG